MNTENNNTNHNNAQHDAAAHDAAGVGAGLDGHAALPAELLAVAGQLDAMATGYRAEMSGAAMVAMARATRPSGAAREGAQLKLVGETVSASALKVGSAGGAGWSLRAGVVGGLLAMAATVALVVAVWPASVGSKSGDDVAATTGGVDAAMQIASSVDDKLSLDEFDALLAEADAIGTLNLETDGLNAS